MFERLLTLPKNHHFFLFGARNTGKSTLITTRFNKQSTLFIDLLDNDAYTRFSNDPMTLSQVVLATPANITHVVIDEIQKVPALLDVVQKLMRETTKKFIMTGSSARKLKAGGANLLAGRAFVYDLFPLTYRELGAAFCLEQALQWGTLPEVFLCKEASLRKEFLNAYAHTYLKEEVWGEQIIKQLPPFRRFLEVAAQSNGKIINYSTIARDVGVDDKTIKSYYLILEDTLLGFFLDAYNHSLRKRLNKKPKFYFFDCGVARALARLSTVPLVESTHAYGNAFEHYLITECLRLSNYARNDYRCSYLRTANDVEIDLVVERPGKSLLCVEIKSAQVVAPTTISSFRKLTKDMGDCEAIVLCNEKYPKKIDHVLVLPWKMGLSTYFS